MSEKKPWQIEKELYDERVEWPDERLLAELKGIPILPDEGDPAWNDDTWHVAYLYSVHSDLAAARRLIAAIPLLYERACYGDPGEMMRGLRNRMEAIVDPYWAVLTKLSMQAAKYPQHGARLWAVDQLGVLRDPDAFDSLVEALSDSADLVRGAARLALEMTCQTNVGCRKEAIAALLRFADAARSEDEKAEAHRVIASIREMD